MIEPDDDAMAVLNAIKRIGRWNDGSTICQVSALLYRAHCLSDRMLRRNIYHYTFRLKKALRVHGPDDAHGT